MTEVQKDLLRGELARIAAEDAAAERSPDRTLAARFYALLFDRAPTVRPLFKGDLTTQQTKFAAMLDMTVRSIDRLDQIVPVLWQSGKRHGGYGAVAEHYAVVGRALHDALAERTAGDPDAPALLAALDELYDAIATVMQSAADEGADDD